MTPVTGGCFRKWIGMAAVIAGTLVQIVNPFPAQAWWDVYHGGFGQDYGSGVAIDGDGNVIVVGYRATEVPPASGDTYHAEGINAYLRKYNNLGNFVCAREVKGPGTPAYPSQRETSDSLSDVAVDSDGNYVVSGTISGDYYSGSYYWTAMYLNKFNSSCAPVWAGPVIYQYPGDSAWQNTFGVALDADDNIYPTGAVFAGWGGYEGAWATWKYSTDGVLQSGFPILYNFSPSYTYTDYSQDVAVDSLGNIIVVGYRGVASGNLDWHVRKYDASRNLLWTDTFTGAANLVDNAYRVAVDSLDNPIVVGYTNKGTSTTANNDWMVIKYAADGVAGQGQRLWTQTYESAPGKDEVSYAVALDPHDNIIIGGIERTDSSTFTGVLALFDGTTGIPLYVTDLPGPSNIIPTRLAYRDGSLAIGGYVYGTSAPNYNDIYVALLDGSLGVDVVPDSFVLPDRTDVALGTVIESEIFTVDGITIGAAVSVTGGEYSVDSGPYVSTAGIVNDGQTVRVRQTSSPSYLKTTDATLTIGGVSDTFSVTTMPDPPPETTAWPAGGFFNKAFKVTLSTSEPATVYYTTNGTTPTAASKPYLAPIPISANTTLKFFGVDTAGNPEDVKTETYVFDKVPPTGGTLMIEPGKVYNTFELSWGGFIEANGIKEYRLFVGTKGYPACNSKADPIDKGLGTELSHAGLTLGQTYFYRICAVDNAGNVSTGATASKKVLEEYDPPHDGKVAIMGLPGDAMTRTTKVTLELSAQDEHGPLMVCVSNDGDPCKKWVGFKSPMPWTMPWTLRAVDGERTVNVLFRDALGNASTKPTPRSIILDRTPPKDGKISIVPTKDYFEITWEEAFDANGVQGYKLVGGDKGYPPCSAPELRVNTDVRYFKDEQLPALGKTKFYRACAWDHVGNMSQGATASQKVLPEYDPPVNGSVVIVAKEPVPYVDGGHTYTGSAAVSLELSAEDDNGPMKVCISNSDVLTCTKWVGFPASGKMPWKLSAGSGEKHVYVLFQDKYGNTGKQYSDTIFLDVTKPVDGELTIKQGAETTTFELSWDGFRDDESGLKDYRLVGRMGKSPGCGDDAYVLTAGTLEKEFTHRGLQSGKTYYYRVCAMDNVGNYTTGATASKKVP